MKKLFTLIFIFASFLSYSQDKATSIGVKFGAHYAIPSSDLKKDFSKSQVRFHGGLFTRENKGSVNILLEALYSNIAFKEADDQSLSIHIINIPLAIEKEMDKASLHIGVSPNIVLSSKAKILGTEIKSELSPLSMDLIAGFGIKVSEEFMVNARLAYPVLNYSVGDVSYLPLTTMLSLNYTFAKIQ